MIVNDRLALPLAYSLCGCQRVASSPSLGSVSQGSVKKAGQGPALRACPGPLICEIGALVYSGVLKIVTRYEKHTRDSVCPCTEALNSVISGRSGDYGSGGVRPVLP